MDIEDAVIKEMMTANEIEDTDEKEADYHLQIARWLKELIELRTKIVGYEDNDK